MVPPLHRTYCTWWNAIQCNVFLPFFRFSNIEAAAVTSRLNAAGLLKKKRRQEVYEPPLLPLTWTCSTHPVWPGLDGLVEHVSRAVSVGGLPVAEDAIRVLNLPQGLGTLMKEMQKRCEWYITLTRNKTSLTPM